MAVIVGIKRHIHSEWQLIVNTHPKQFFFSRSLVSPDNICWKDFTVYINLDYILCRRSFGIVNICAIRTQLLLIFFRIYRLEFDISIHICNFVRRQRLLCFILTATLLEALTLLIFVGFLVAEYGVAQSTQNRSRNGRWQRQRSQMGVYTRDPTLVFKNGKKSLLFIFAINHSLNPIASSFVV